MALALITKTETRIDCTDVKTGDPIATLDTELDVETLAELLSLGHLGLDGSDLVVVDAQHMEEHGSALIGKISTDHPRGNVASLIKSGMLQVVEIDDLKPSTRKKVAPKASSKKPVTTKPTAPAPETTEDDLDEDLDEDEPTSDQPQGASPRLSESPDADKTPAPITIDPSLSGIPIRIQQVLTASNLGTKSAIESYVAEGKKLIDVDGIGPRTEMHLTAWLAGQPWPETK